DGVDEGGGERGGPGVPDVGGGTVARDRGQRAGRGEELRVGDPERAERALRGAGAGARRGDGGREQGAVQHHRALLPGLVSFSELRVPGRGADAGRAGGGRGAPPVQRRHGAADDQLGHERRRAVLAGADLAGGGGGGERHGGGVLRADHGGLRHGVRDAGGERSLRAARGDRDGTGRDDGGGGGRESDGVRVLAEPAEP